MRPYPWWTPEQVAFQKEVSDFLDTMYEEEAKTRWTREIPYHILEEIGKKGYIGAAIPKEYGGLDLGCTGSVILADEIWTRFPGIGRVVVGNMNGGLRQIYEHGTEEQKKKYLPIIAGGQTGAVAITETTAGTDAAGITLQAVKQGNKYILNGKKRFIVGAGVADRYFVYAQTSTDPDVVKKHKHLTAFIVMKGAPGFKSEKINEILGFENVQNGSLDFKNVEVDEADRIGEEGDGWKILMGGLNFERTNISGTFVGMHRQLLKYVVEYSERRVQFGKATIDIAANQDKIANIVMRLKILRDSVYVTAYDWDREEDITIDASTVKCLGAEMALASANEATQILGGDGINRFYPVQNIFEVAKSDHIAGGTVEACRLTIFRQTLKRMREDIKMPRRVLDPELRVPVPTIKPVESKKPATAENLLDLLAENYLINPGLHMTPADIAEYLDGDVAKAIADLVASGDAATINDRKSGAAKLVRATYPGLNKAKDQSFYEWYPEHVLKDSRRFF
jgi:alkylation response protein AidB-like acyl-CoA dehydrogenase